jgi:hypothetical protein
VEYKVKKVDIKEHNIKLEEIAKLLEEEKQRLDDIDQSTLRDAHIKTPNHRQKFIDK